MSDKIQVGIISICVSSEGRMMPCCTIPSRLLTSACASRHAPCVPCWIALRESFAVRIISMHKADQ